MHLRKAVKGLLLLLCNFSFFYPPSRPTPLSSVFIVANSEISIFAGHLQFTWSATRQAGLSSSVECTSLFPHSAGVLRPLYPTSSRSRQTTQCVAFRNLSVSYQKITGLPFVSERHVR